MVAEPTSCQSRPVREPLILREIGIEIADVVVVVRLGTRTLEDDHLDRATAEAHGRWGIWGFSVLEVPGGDYRQLVRLRPFVATRRLLFRASAADLVTAGFPSSPPWTLAIVMVLPSPTIVGNGRTSRVDRFQGVRPHPLSHSPSPCRGPAARDHGNRDDTSLVYGAAAIPTAGRAGSVAAVGSDRGVDRGPR